MHTQKHHGKKTLHKKRKTKSVRRKRTIRRRKMRGGVSFNEQLNFAEIPKADYIPLNTEIGSSGDPQNGLVDSRLLMGGKIRKRLSRRNRTKRSRRRRGRKMKGGSLMGTDLLTGLSTSTSNEVLSFGTTGGTNLMNANITGSASQGGPELHATTTMVPIA